MRGASSVSKYVGLAEQEAFDIEYWLLEEAKLQRNPKPRSLAGRVALITGGAGGIGRAIAAKFLSEGACVALADIDAASLEEAVAGFSKQYGGDNVTGVAMDVTSEAAVEAAFRDAVLRFGGAIVFIASKNALAASAGASAYCAAKAAEVHLARCLALEGAPYGIRVNTVNPDAVLRGSKIWQGEWRQQRAASNKVSEDGLEEVYRQRSLLKLSVYPEDIAEGVYFFASDLSAKSTGNILNVDAGNVQSFTR